MATSHKFIPGSNVPPVEIFTYPFFIDKETKEFIISHGKIMFIIRGPPGTGKWSLTQLMMDHFRSAVKCSADDYFANTFNPLDRNKETLAQSHFYCHTRVRDECTKNSHPLIVSNTHVKKSEMQEYFNLAAEYEYTVIICSTLDKFVATPEILAKSNTKGLNENYFKNRLKAWEDIFPVFMGWFLCPDDSSYILHELQCALNALLGDGKFCRVFDTFDSDTLLSNYKAKTLLCCMAGFMKNNLFELKDYCKSTQVRESLGKCFVITVSAFLVTKNNIFAIVELTEDLQKLIFKPNCKNLSCGDEHVDSIISSMKYVSLRNSYNFKFTPLTNEFPKNPKTVVLEERFINDLDMNHSSFIHVAQSEEKEFSFYELNELYKKSFTSFTEQEKMSSDELSIVEDDYTVYRLTNDDWVIQIPQKLKIKTVFTGLYI